MKMDIDKLLRNINNLNEYIAVTQEASQKCKISKLELSLSSAHALKKIRSFEIEHVNKCEERGIACVIFERLLSWAPSKAWGVVSKDLVLLLQYWLDAVRKHLVKHNPHWWSFLKLLLKFIKEIGQKHSSIPNLLVEHTSECLLDLATNDKPDAMQKFEILHCFNIYCSESSKEMRFALRNKFLDYFTKLGAYMCNCGHLPTQYSIIETLLRWLLPRKDAALRIASATKWFPARLYSEEVVDIFLARPWTSFLQDARDMLNKHNESSDLITSVVCRKLSVGDIVIIPNCDEVQSWLDINCASKCLSVLLGPRALDKFGCPYHRSFEMFYVSADNTHSATLHRGSRRLVISVETVTPPQIMPSCISLGDDVSCHVTVVLTSQCDPTRLDTALRKIFDDKYQMLADLEKEITPPPAEDDIPPIITEEQKKKIESMLNNLRRQLTQSQAKETGEVKNNNESEAPADTSHITKDRPASSGYKTLRLRQPLSCVSPSTASTSSLAQLHEKLAALPRHKFDKVPEWTCAAPDLSVVTEVSEPDDRSTSTIEYRAYGVRTRNKKILDSSRRSQSDTESLRRHPVTSRKAKPTPLSPVPDINTANSLLAAILDLADVSVINDTAEKLPEATDLDALNVDLLYQEAIQASQEKNRDKNDGDNNTQDKRPQDANENCDTIEDTQNVQVNTEPKRKTKVIFSTSDESNTEAISDTPNVYVTTRRNKRVKPKVITEERTSFDVQMVEEFFSQHFTENKLDDITISPKLARKLNASSSEAEDDLQDIEPYDFNNCEVLECLNNIVDKVCQDFEKCTEYLNNEQVPVVEDNNSDPEDDMPLKDIINKLHNTEDKIKTTKKSNDRTIKLKYKAAPKKSTKTNSRATKLKNKLEIQETSKISTIIEEKEDKVEEIETTKVTTIEEKGDEVAETDTRIIDNKQEKNKEAENTKTLNADDKKEDSKKAEVINEPITPAQRRKRKLFSPKDEQIPEEVPALTQPEDIFTDSKMKRTPKSTVTYKPYKEIEKERKRVRTSRNRKSKTDEPPSPRSKKMNDLFNKVKESANGEQVKIANKTTNLDVYNFSTDSEDDFKEKKIEISKKASTTTLESENSTVLRRGRVVKRVNYTKANNGNNTKRITNKRQTNTKKKIKKESEHDLADETMRENKETLDTSIVVENSKRKRSLSRVSRVSVSEPEFALEKPPEMEIINEKQERLNETEQKPRRTRKNKAKTDELNKESKKTQKVKPNVDNNRTESPLPGLVVEEAPLTNKEDGDLSANMVDKFKRICQNPEKYINESNTTQNLLSDNERNICSPQTFEITEELIQVETEINKDKNPKGKVTKKKKTNSVKARKLDTKARQIKEMAEIINVTRSEPKSNESIASAGITAHGDSEEAPPSPKLIIERLEHRNLETEYLDHSTKHYFDKLTEEINDINDICRNYEKERNKSHDTHTSDEIEVIHNNIKDVDSPKSQILKSPVVSIERISLEDISRWLPSRRTSDSEYNSPSSSKSKSKSKDVNKKSKSPKIKETAVVKSSDSEPEVQEVDRISLKLVYTKSPVFKINNSGASKRSQNAHNKSDNSIKAKKSDNGKTVMPLRGAKYKSQSIISPIKLFDDLVSNADKNSQVSLSDDDEYMNEIKATLYKQMASRLKTCGAEEESVKETRSAKNAKSSMSKAISDKCRVKSVSSESRQDPKVLKRRSEVDRDGLKRQKVEDNNNIGDLVSASGATASSVDDWLMKSERGSSSKAAELNVLTKDSIQAVIEKLDTTLIEIHQNTSNKFVHLFVSAQQQLRGLKRERQDLYKRVAGDILAGVVALIDDKFADLDKRSQEQDATFMKQLSEQASAVIRDDLKQKRVMVQLLKEDVLAVEQHIAKKH